MFKAVIVAIGYNRPKSMERLLKSLVESSYSNYSVDLIVSIDKSEAQHEVSKVAETLSWLFGKKILINHDSRLGLRQHVLLCGDLVEDYDAVIMFEDDIVVAHDFFNFTIKAMEYYGDDDRIAGISLYSPSMNEMVEKPFIPVSLGSDVYALQSAQSWGQAWNKRMWYGFRSWYEENNIELQDIDDMPKKIYSWPNSSWKKYFMKYLVKQDKYFIYPYLSLSTNCSEVGQHVFSKNSHYQVPMQQGSKNYNYAKFEELVKYDIFFESVSLASYLEDHFKFKLVVIDLYSSRTFIKGECLLLTKRALNIERIQSYCLNYKPHEINVYKGEYGQDIYLYKLNEGEKLYLKGRVYSDANYFSGMHWIFSLYIGLNSMIQFIKRKLSFR